MKDRFPERRQVVASALTLLATLAASATVGELLAPPQEHEESPLERGQVRMILPGGGGGGSSERWMPQ